MGFDKLKSTVVWIVAAVLSPTARAQTDSEGCVKWHVDAVSEGQWNVRSGQANWVNMLAAGVGMRTWHGGALELGALATGRLKDDIVDDLQGFSNIDAANRAFRLTHLGVGQQLFGHLYVYAGLREADEDYFNTDGAGIFTGSSYGCVPQAGENFDLGVYPEAALGLHLEYAPAADWTLRASVYNGRSSDRISRQFRFRPGRDGLAFMGSLTYSPCHFTHGDGLLTPTCVVGYVAGWQYDDAADGVTQRTRRRGSGLWTSIDSPVARIGRSALNLFATGGLRVGQIDAARGHWAAALIWNNVTRSGGNLAMGVSQARYAGPIRETDFETTFEYPFLHHFKVQPALHVIRTDGKTQVAANLCLSISLGNL